MAHNPQGNPNDPPLSRLEVERALQHKYRFAQSLVFGIPVVALQAFGPSLGGPEAGRWVGLLQLLLAGWVMYVGALGMVGDAVIRRRLTPSFIAAAVALLAYLANVGHLLRVPGLRQAPWAGAGFLIATLVVTGAAGAAYLVHRRGAATLTRSK